MKIQIFKPGSGGPKVFLSRLCQYLQDHYGVQIVSENPDIYFSTVWRGNPPRGCRVVHRADGAYFNYEKRSHHGLNRRIAHAINQSSGVIYQSEYSHQICRKIARAKAKKLEKIIFNGVDHTIYNNIPIDKMGYDKVFVASALWRPLKRPRSIAKGFITASIPNSVLIMIGPISQKDMIRDPNIKYVGKVNRKDVFKYFKAADAVINISRLDACPNVAVESLASGVPVVCNNVGGGPELVQKDGIILDIDPPFQYKKFHMKNPDKVKPHIVAEGFKKIINQKWNIYRPDLFMENTAREYYNFFCKVLG